MPQHIPIQEEALRQFQSYLKNTSQHFTQARRIVFDTVFANHSHFDASQLIEQFRSGPNAISRGTVYSTLHLLEKAGLIQSIYEDERHLHYEHTFGHDHHDHFYCEDCGRTIEFLDETVEQALMRVCRNRHFKHRHHSLRITGVCRKCRQADSHRLAGNE